MRYTLEFKKKAIDMYRKGKWIDTPEGVSQKRFRAEIREWVRLEEQNSIDVLKHNTQNKVWSAEDKYELVARVIAGESYTSVAISAGINSGLLYQWVRKYREQGYNGLVNTKKGRPSKNPMKKVNYNNPRKIEESEYEELIRLRAENQYIKAEIEVIKKEIALREEKEAAQLKAKKQQSSKNLVKKDSQ